jgi:hypothetical protein
VKKRLRKKIAKRACESNRKFEVIAEKLIQRGATEIDVRRFAILDKLYEAMCPPSGRVQGVSPGGLS